MGGCLLEFINTVKCEECNVFELLMSPSSELPPPPSFKQIDYSESPKQEQSDPTVLDHRMKRTQSSDKTFKRNVIHSIHIYCLPSLCQAELESGNEVMNQTGRSWDLILGYIPDQE